MWWLLFDLIEFERNFEELIWLFIVGILDFVYFFFLLFDEEIDFVEGDVDVVKILILFFYIVVCFFYCLIN